MCEVLHVGSGSIHADGNRQLLANSFYCHYFLEER